MAIKHQLSDYFRNKRDKNLKVIISDLHRKFDCVRIIDLGGTTSYWKRFGEDFLLENSCHITLVNLSNTEIGESSDKTLYQSIIGDVTNLSFLSSKSFELVHSNSVVEHLGTWSSMKNFASECHRLAHHYYVQTPSFGFPIDPHYAKFPMIHWLPRPIRAWLLHKLPLAAVGKIKTLDSAYDVVDSSRLLSKQQMKILFPHAIFKNEIILGLIKSFVVHNKI